MKNFAIPLLINGDIDQLNQLSKELESLGYDVEQGMGGPIMQLFTCKNHRPHSACICRSMNWEFINEDRDYPRTIVSANDKELVLALAAMVDDNSFYKGEWVVALSDTEPQFTKGKLYCVRDYRDIDTIVLIVQDDSGSKTNGWYACNFRKATKQEIINHFTKQLVIGEWNMEQKAIVGYKVKKGIETVSAGRALNTTFSHPYKLAFQVDTTTHKEAERTGLLDLLFEPVYEEKKVFIEIIHGARGERRPLKVEIKDDENLAYVDGHKFGKTELQDLILPRHCGRIGIVKFVPTFFTIGCNGQYKYVSREDIQKVIDALK